MTSEERKEFAQRVCLMVGQGRVGGDWCAFSDYGERLRKAGLLLLEAEAELDETILAHATMVDGLLEENERLRSKPRPENVE